MAEALAVMAGKDSAFYPVRMVLSSVHTSLGTRSLSLIIGIDDNSQDCLAYTPSKCLHYAYRLASGVLLVFP